MFTHKYTRLESGVNGVFYSRPYEGLTPQKVDLGSNFPNIHKMDISEPEKMARMRAVARIDEIITSLNKTTEESSNIITNQWRVDMVEELKEINNTLRNTPNIDKGFWDTEIETRFQGWHSKNDVDFREIARTTMSRRIFLTRVINDIDISVKVINPTVPEKVTELEPNQLKQLNRFKRLLTALETNDPDFPRHDLRKAMRLLNEGKLDDAIDGFKTVFEDEKNSVLVSAIYDDQGLIDAMRAMKFRSEVDALARENAMKSAKETTENTNTKQYNEGLLSRVSTGLGSPNNQRKGENLYNQYLNSLPPTDPKRNEIIKNKDAIIKELILTKIFTDYTKEYLETNGPDGLSDALKTYDDMKGISGAWYENWSDENIELGKEGLILVGSIIATAGVSSLISVMAGAARLGQIWVATRAISAGAKGNKIRAGSWAVGAKTAGGVATAGEFLVGAERALATGGMLAKTGKIVIDGTVFTLSEIGMRTALRGEGESGLSIDDMVTKFGKNIAMFGGLAAMGKLTGGIAAKYLPGGVDPATPFFSASKLTTVAGFTLGDYAVIQALHAAETGEIKFWDVNSFLFALAFRGTMHGKLPDFIKQQFPNLSGKFEASVLNSKSKMSRINNARLEGEKLKDAIENTVNTMRGTAGRQLELTEAGMKEIAKIREIGSGNVLSETARDIASKRRALIEKGGLTRQEASIIAKSGLVSRIPQVQRLKKLKVEHNGKEYSLSKAEQGVQKVQEGTNTFTKRNFDALSKTKKTEWIAKMEQNMPEGMFLMKYKGDVVVVNQKTATKLRNKGEAIEAIGTKKPSINTPKDVLKGKDSLGINIKGNDYALIKEGNNGYIVKESSGNNLKFDTSKHDKAFVSALQKKAGTNYEVAVNTNGEIIVATRSQLKTLKITEQNILTSPHRATDFLAGKNQLDFIGADGVKYTFKRILVRKGQNEVYILKNGGRLSNGSTFTNGQIKHIQETIGSSYSIVQTSKGRIYALPKTRIQEIRNASFNFRNSQILKPNLNETITVNKREFAFEKGSDDIYTLKTKQSDGTLKEVTPNELRNMSPEEVNAVLAQSKKLGAENIVVRHNNTVLVGEKGKIQAHTGKSTADDLAKITVGKRSRDSIIETQDSMQIKKGDIVLFRDGKTHVYGKIIEGNNGKIKVMKVSKEGKITKGPDGKPIIREIKSNEVVRNEAIKAFQDKLHARDKKGIVGWLRDNSKKSIATVMVALGITGTAYAADALVGDEDPNKLADTFLGLFKGGKINVELTDRFTPEQRVAFSNKFISHDATWQSAIEYIEKQQEFITNRGGAQFLKYIEAVVDLSSPTQLKDGDAQKIAQSVATLQSYLNMASGDINTGRDGIIGYRTTRQLTGFLRKNFSIYNQQQEKDDRIDIESLDLKLTASEGQKISISNEQYEEVLEGIKNSTTLKEVYNPYTKVLNVTALQKALKDTKVAISYNGSNWVDGNFGPSTLAALNEYVNPSSDAQNNVSSEPIVVTETATATEATATEATATEATATEATANAELEVNTKKYTNTLQEVQKNKKYDEFFTDQEYKDTFTFFRENWNKIDTDSKNTFTEVAKNYIEENQQTGIVMNGKISLSPIQEDGVPGFKVNGAKYTNEKDVFLYHGEGEESVNTQTEMADTGTSIESWRTQKVREDQGVSEDISEQRFNKAMATIRANDTLKSAIKNNKLDVHALQDILLANNPDTTLRNGIFSQNTLQQIQEYQTQNETKETNESELENIDELI